MKTSPLDMVANVLVVVGGLNWGLVGWLNYNLVDALLGEDSTAGRVVYVLVGLSALWVAYLMVKMFMAGKKAE